MRTNVRYAFEGVVTSGELRRFIQQQIPAFEVIRDCQIERTFALLYGGLLIGETDSPVDQSSPLWHTPRPPLE